MLYLTRKVGESILIDDDIEVKIISVNGKTVKLGFKFPKGTAIFRKELIEKIEEENISASASIEINISEALKDFNDKFEK